MLGRVAPGARWLWFPPGLRRGGGTVGTGNVAAGQAAFETVAARTDTAGAGAAALAELHLFLGEDALSEERFQTAAGPRHPPRTASHGRQDQLEQAYTGLRVVLDIARTRGTH